MVFKGLMCIAFIYLVFFLCGVAVRNIIKSDKGNIFQSILYGFVFVMALFEVVSFPFLIVKDKFNLLCVIFSGVLIAIILYAVYCMRDRISGIRLKRKTKCNFNSLTKKSEYIKYILPAMFIVLLLIQLYLISYMHFNCYDDGYYTAVSNAAVEQNIIELNDTVAYSGNYIFEDSCTRPGISSWEILIAYISKVFSIHPAILMHTFLPVLLLPICYIAANEVFKKITKTFSEKYLCLIIYALICTYSGNGFLVSSYMTVGTWTGKAMLFHVVLPLILSVCIEIYQGRQEAALWCELGLISIAGVGFTATGIYTVPIYCLSLALPYAIQLVCKKEYKTIKLLLKNAILSMSIFIAIGLYALVQMKLAGNNWAENYAGLDWKNIYIKAFLQNKLLFIIYMISLIVLFMVESLKQLKLLLIGQAVAMFLIILNPIFVNSIAVSITGIPVYWRMVLLLSIMFIVPIGINYISQGIRGKAIKLNRHINMVSISLVIAFFIIISKNQSIFDVYTEHQNYYMIPDSVLDICKSFDLSSGKSVTILADQSINKFFRQYSSYFDVVVGRDDQIKMDSKGEKYFNMYRQIFNDKKIDDSIMEYLQEFSVEYIVIEEDLIGETEGLYLDRKVRGYNIYVID